MSVDYTQWERSQNLLHNEKKESCAKPINSESFTWGAFSVSNNPSRVGSACSLSKCNHPWNNFRAREAARLGEEKKRARMKEIKVKIRLHEKTLHEIRSRQAELIKSNLDMFHLIEMDEKFSVKQADDCLRRYQKSRDGIHVMRDRFERQKLELQQELEELKQRLDVSTDKLKGEVKSVLDEVREIYEELALLNNYKDKVYPERLILIHQLKQQLASTQLDNEIFEQLFSKNVLLNAGILQLRGFGEEETELLEVIQAEHGKLLSLERQSKEAMQARVAQRALSECHQSITGMADENKKLLRDMEFHRQQNRRLRAEVSELETSIRDLLSDPECSLQKSMFPQIFSKRDRCTPDMDVVLDIPIRKLPII